MAITGTLFGLAKTKNEIDSVEIFKSMMLEVNASGAVVMDGRNIAAGSIYANQLSANSITASKIKAGEITTDHITTSGISADKIKAGTLTATNGASWINMNNGQFSFGNGKIVYNGSTLTINVESLSISNNPVATKNDVSTVVNGIQIGGDNLISGSQYIATQPNNTGTGTSVLKTNESIPYYTITAATGSTISVFESPIFSWMSANAIVGNTYTISVDVRLPANGTVRFMLSGSDSNVLASKWTRIFYTFVYSANLRVAGFVYAGTTMDYRNWKLEDGNKGTGWSLSSREIENRVTQAQGTADDANQTANTVKGVITKFDSSIINANPIFLDWIDVNPASFTAGQGALPSKVVSGNGMGNALKYTVAANVNTYVTPTQTTTFPFFQYITIEFTFKLESGTIDGAGLLFRYNATPIIDVLIGVKETIPTPILNKWYTVTKVIKRETAPAAFTGYSTYPMGGYNAIQTVTAKVIHFDSIKTRQSTEQEINAYESSIMIEDMSVDSKITPVEKVQLKKEWATIASERTSLDGKAATFGVTTERTSMTNAYNTLNTVLNGTTGILINMKTTSTVTAATFRAQFDDYYEKKAILERKIDETSRELASSATDLAQAMTTGKMLFKDPTFKSGVNGVTVYNNTANGLVVLSRIAKPSDAPTTSTHALQIRTTGAASPENGGFIQGFSSRANVKFVMRIIAKIPVGYTLKTASNPLGTGYTDVIITSDKGTGKYEEYIRLIQCGTTGTFSSGGHFYLSGPTPTAAAPLDWFVAYATAFDITDMDYTLSDIETLANVTKDKTDNWTYTGTIEINGGKIRADTVTATQIAANTITANQIATNAIIADKILANSITTAKIATNAVTANEIAANTITATEIKANTITASQIAATTITANQIATNAITADKVIANAITTAKIATNAVTANEIAANTITATEIKARTLTADKIVAGSLTSNEIAANSITIGNINPQAFSQGYVTTNPIFSDWTSTYPTGYAVWSGSAGLTKETTLTKNGGFGARFAVTAATTQTGLTLTSAGTINNQVLPKYLVVELDFMLVSGGLGGAGVLVDWTGVTGTNRVTVALQNEVVTPTLNKWYTVRKVIKAPSLAGPFTTISGYLMGNYSSGMGNMVVKNIIFDRFALREPSTEEINTFEGNVSNAVTTINNEGVTVKDGSFYLEDNSSSVKYSMQTKTNPIRDHSFELLKPQFRHETLDMWTIESYTNVDATNSPVGGSDFTIVGTPYVYVDYIKDENSTSTVTPIFGSTSGVVTNGSYFFAKVWNFVKPSKKYTVSAYFKKMPGTAGGTPRISIQHVTGANDVVAATLATPIFPAVTNEVDAVRYSTTFTIPANYSIANTDEIKISVLSGNASWVMVDGLQLTDAEYPSQYNDEKTAFDIARGSILFPVFEANQAYVKGLNVGGYVSSAEYVSQRIMPGENLNSYVKAGWYYCPSDAESVSILSTPINNAFSLFVEKHAGSRQTFGLYKSGDISTWVRNMYNGSWGPWIQTDGSLAPMGIAKENGWANYGGAYATPSYIKDSNNIVYLRGMTDSGTRTAGVRMGTLPSGYRPINREIFQVHAYNNTTIRLDVTPEGFILFMQSPSGYVSLSGVSFQT